MHTWVRRGFQTALVTGGLLMLGTGIASADENVNPDLPANPVDAGVSVPIDTSQNAVGTPFGQYQTPSVHRNISTGDVTGGDLGTQALPTRAVSTKALPTRALPTNALPTNALPNTGNLPVGQATSALGQANPLMRQASPELQGLGGNQGIFRGNRVHADVVVPIELCGNAIAVGGDAAEDATCSQTIQHSDPIVTNGDDEALAGNVVAVNGAIPVQLTGNAIAAAGDAYAHTVAGQSGTTGGDIRTSGAAGTVAGTIGAAQVATPVQVADNAIAGAGTAGADSASEDDATSKGSLRTSGKSGTAAGTVAGVPVAVPAQVDGNGISGIGNAASKSTST
ncbi:MAG TPA: chaplin family protein, partial [Pseudonocardiaceae bacterium]|nr:chaplin family protein [Pseudonocardiaceae bacterium]